MSRGLQCKFTNYFYEFLNLNDGGEKKDGSNGTMAECYKVTGGRIIS